MQGDKCGIKPYTILVLARKKETTLCSSSNLTAQEKLTSNLVNLNNNALK